MKELSAYVSAEPCDPEGRYYLDKALRSAGRTE
jgi:hypothetical protein